MTDEEALKLQDTIGSALSVFAGVEQCLGYVDESSTDYHMCHMLMHCLSVMGLSSVMCYR